VLKKIGLVFLGKGLKDSLKSLFSKPPNKDTIAEVSAQIVYRIIKIQLLTILLAALPLLLTVFEIVIFIRQTTIFEKQTELIDQQIKQADRQIELVELQNAKIDSQNVLMGSQTQLMSLQTQQTDRQIDLTEGQNLLVFAQNKSISQQSVLLESSRRSALVSLMSNILDKLDDELKHSPDRKVSPELTARIVALANSFKPYYALEGNRISERKLSPERGQLLVALMKSSIHDSSLILGILSVSNFSYSDLRNVKLEGANFSMAQLPYSDFSGASNLASADFTGADLRGCNFSTTNLTDSHFELTDMRNAIFDSANLVGVEVKNCQTEGISLEGAKYYEDELNFSKHGNH